ncbi:unnamed protein product, partial [Brachionus calyciflorus]
MFFVKSNLSNDELRSRIEAHLMIPLPANPARKDSPIIFLS